MNLLAKIRKSLRFRRSGDIAEQAEPDTTPSTARRSRRPGARLAPSPPRSGVATAPDGSARLSFESTGDGPEVLLIGGLGMTAGDWWRTVPVLARSFRVITFDNRGVGRSDSAQPPSSVPQMADDAAAVIAASGVDSAYVYGVSLGGMVAQELALRHPDRVNGLVLGATTPGGFLAAPPDPGVLAYFMRHGTMTSEQAAWAAVPHLYSRRTQAEHPERIAEDAARRLSGAVDPSVYKAQASAGMRHDARSRLGAILAPTLVVHGEEDAVVPPANGRTLATHIPDAELHMWSHAGHVFTTDQPEADRQIAAFLERHAEDRSVAARDWSARVAA
jgi:pimeloyl-ACP methyl ester carboxylesterase